MSTSEKNRPKWYINPSKIRSKKNHSWTRLELNKAYTLRVQGESVPDIIRKLKISVKKTQVYNVIRLLRKNHKNKCFQCGHSLTQEELKSQQGRHFKRCIICKKDNEQKKLKFRKKSLRKKLCGSCGRRRLMPGRKTCIRCVSYVHRHRIFKGLCGSCGRYSINRKRSIALCNACLDHNVKYARRHRRQLA